IKGRDLVAGVPKTLIMNSDEVREALSEPVNQIVDAVRSVLERTPPELAADIVDRGIVLTGGGSQLRNLDVLLREETGLPVMVSDTPECAVVLGTGSSSRRIREGVVVGVTLILAIVAMRMSARAPGDLSTLDRGILHVVSPA